MMKIRPFAIEMSKENSWPKRIDYKENTTVKFRREKENEQETMNPQLMAFERA